MKTWIGVHLPQVLPKKDNPRWRARQAIDGTSLALLQYTPEVARVDDDTFVMDASASLSLFGGAHALCHRVRTTLRRLGVIARVSVAPTATGALLLATHTRHNRRRVLTHTSLARLLDALPCSRLPQARPYLSWLDGIGCASLADLRRLPRTGLRQRTSKAIVQALDAAYGMAPELFAWVTAPLVFSGHVELVRNIEHAHAALFVAQQLIEQLCGWLVAHRRAVTHAKLALTHEHGKHAMPPTIVDIVLRLPTWRAEHLVHLLSEHLHRLELPAPVVAITLTAENTQAMSPITHELFPEPGAGTTDRQHLIEQLAARLGRANLLQASPIADHRPEIANHWVPVDASPSKPSGTANGPADATGGRPAGTINAERPFWLLAKPIALPTRQYRPFYGSPLYRVSGPERIEDGWWSGLVVRDYFVAQSGDGTRYWIFQDRGEQGGWFLHGLFG